MPRFASLFVLLLLFAFAPDAEAQRVACTGGSVTPAGSSTSYACSNVDFLSNLPINAMGGGGGEGNDIWGWTDPETGKEYALVGLENGTSFVDVSTPTEPVYLGRLPTHTSDSIWRDIKVYADHAFIGSEADGHGIQVFDLTQLRDVTSPTTFSETAHYAGIGSSHNVAINEATGFAYVVGSRGSQGCSGGLHMVNVQDPENPTFAGCFGDDGYTHDVQCVTYDGPDTDYTGDEICFASNEDTITIVNVTNKNRPVQLSQIVYPNIGYVHQGWLTEDQHYFISDDELDEITFGGQTRTLVSDVSDLDNPEFISAYRHPVSSIDHNLYVKGRYAYASNYTSGLRILDTDEIEGGGDGILRMVAFFDTYPSSNAAFFDGTWSNYPFFESGIVIVNDISNGLFVLQPMLDPSTASEDAAAPGERVLEAYPNPFTDQTRLSLRLGQAEHVTAEVYDALGRRVQTLFEGTVGAGETRQLVFNGAGRPAGLYVVRVTGETFSESKRVVLAR